MCHVYVQEEFDRFTAYWWQPEEGFDGRIYRILFEEVSTVAELGLELLTVVAHEALLQSSHCVLSIFIE